jgi:hypothetical protein
MFDCHVCVLYGSAQAAGGYGSSSSNSSDEELARRSAAKRDTVRNYIFINTVLLVYWSPTGSIALLTLVKQQR